MNKKITRHFLTLRDKQILFFLWKYKVVSTAMIHHRYFSGMKSSASYSILSKLRRYSYIECRTNEFGQKPIWVLTKRGFSTIKAALPELKQNGFMSENKEHDFTCSAIQLGNFIKETPANLQIVSEQMLRNFDKEFLPKLIPNPEIHRPDGYWYLTSGKDIKLISLEVELNQKATLYYEAYSSFYEKFPANSRVLWVVKTKKQAKKIYETMYEYEPDYEIHNFLLLKDVYEQGWEAEIFAGIDHKKTILNLFEENITQFPHNSHSISCEELLNNRKLTYEYYSEIKNHKKIQNSNSMGVSYEKAR